MPPVAKLAGRYELGAVLGAGGFATVYRAHDSIEGRDVAIKVIPAPLRGATPVPSDAIATALVAEELTAELERFRQEALALSRLRSRHIARVHDFGRDDGVGLFLVMELIDGVALDIRSLGRALMPHEVLRVARGLLAGLAEAHAHGIVHRDVKPSNVLIPKGRKGLDDPRILDFGIARDEQRTRLLAARGRVESEGENGAILGTPAFMAPEQLRDGVSSPASDVYAAGLVLFELLGMGTLYPGDSLRQQIAARLSTDVMLEGRVASPLGALLTRMLARDPAKRFRDASEALDAIVDLETAPVTLGEIVPPEDDEVQDDPHWTRRTGDRHALLGPSDATGAWGPRSSFAPPVPERAPERVSPVPPLTDVRSPSVPVFGAKRLSRLARDPAMALVESLHALDLAMIDALARRERGSTASRIARAVALALRLELDAAALILEPLTATSDLARAFGSTLVAPRARRATRARVDADKTDSWIATIDAELAAMLASLATAMTVRDDAARNEDRCKRALDRLGRSAAPATVTTLRIAHVNAASLAGTMPMSAAITEALRLRDSERSTPSPFHVLIRALLLGVVGFRADEHLAREQLERAAKIAAETSNTLFETRAIVGWGGMLVEIPERVDQGLGVLERATTLLAHGDAPSLEHIAEHNRGAALVIQGRYAEAAPHLRRAREAAKGELSLEHEILSCMNEGFSHICLGQREAAARTVEELGDARLVQVSPRTAAYCHVVRSIYAMLYEDADRARSELRRAHARAAEAEAEGADAYLLAEALGILYASARHEEIDLLARAGELQKLAHDRGFVSFYWFEVLRAMVAQIRDPELRARVGETLERLVVMLGSATSS